MCWTSVTFELKKSCNCEHKKKVSKNTKIYDSEKRVIGRVVNIFGPVSDPYLAIAPSKGMRITKIIGREVYKK